MLRDAVQLGRIETGQPLAHRRIQPEDMRFPGAVPEQLQKFAIEAIDLGAEPRFRPFLGHLLGSRRSWCGYYIWSIMDQINRQYLIFGPKRPNMAKIRGIYARHR